jgi:hypothetical protein
MSIFEALDVRKRIEHEYDIVDKLSQQYIRHTPEGPQCAACGMVVVGFEPRHRASSFLRMAMRASEMPPGRYVMDHLSFQHTGDIAKILGVTLSSA